MLQLIGKIFILIDCFIVGVFGSSFPFAWHWHPLFCILIGITFGALCLMVLSSVKVFGRIAQVISGALWGYFFIAKMILEQMDNPDMIWTWGISIISVIVCIALHFGIASAAQPD